jgi:hypothetical protein
MRTALCLVSALGLLVSIAPAAQYDYGWEDGGTILGSFGNLVDPTNVSGSQTGQAGDAGTYECPGPNSGTYYLHVAEEPHSSTPQAYIAYIENLTDGDVIDASYFGYDVTPDASPSLRIWAHYALSGDVNSYAGSAGGNDTYTAGTGWDQVAWSWTFDSDGGTRDALVIEARLYSAPSTGEYRTDYFIDDVSVTAPDTAMVTFAPEPASLLLLGLAGLLIRRR